MASSRTFLLDRLHLHWIRPWTRSQSEESYARRGVIAPDEGVVGAGGNVGAVDSCGTKGAAGLLETTPAIVRRRGESLGTRNVPMPVFITSCTVAPCWRATWLYRAGRDVASGA